MTCGRTAYPAVNEPTNHLDVDSQALIQAINGFAGAVVIVSHDPHVLELTADRFWLVADGGVTAYDGNLDEYKALLLGGSKKAVANDTAQMPEKSEVSAVDKREKRRQAPRNVWRWHPYASRSRGWKSMWKTRRRQGEIEQKMADPELYEGSADALVCMQKDLGWISQQLAEAEEAWLIAHHELEAAEERVGWNQPPRSRMSRPPFSNMLINRRTIHRLGG